MEEPGFIDRLDAGRHLAAALVAYKGTDAVVLGLARGGVAVGFPIAAELGLPLRALVVRKIGAPINPELAIGAVSETGERWIDDRTAESVHATQSYIEAATNAEIAEARRRQAEYGTAEGLRQVRGRPAIVVDDGIATGSTALVALRSARGLGASQVVLATPVASAHAVSLLRPYADRIVCLATPEPFYAVGLHYEHFDQVTDDEVKRYLREAS